MTNKERKNSREIQLQRIRKRKAFHKYSGVEVYEPTKRVFIRHDKGNVVEVMIIEEKPAPSATQILQENFRETVKKIYGRSSFPESKRKKVKNPIVNPPPALPPAPKVRIEHRTAFVVNFRKIRKKG